MADRFDLDITYLKMAKVWSGLSKARRKRVGCLIVKDGMIISDGYNGTPRGFDNSCELMKNGDEVDDELMQSLPAPKISHLITRPEVLHAESNAITKLAKSTQSSEGATMYITCSPCLDCAKLIIQAGISRVVFQEVYRNDEGIRLLWQAKIPTCSINLPKEFQ